MSDVSRRDALKLIGAGAAALTLPRLLGCGAKDIAGRRPNVVVILADDLRYDAIGCAGDRRLQTPNIDRLAGEGVRFTNAFVTTSLCSPSRAAFLTGCYAHTQGVFYNEMRDPLPSVPMFPELLQRAGYETAFVGKWHMLRRATPRRGFDHWVAFNGQGAYFRNTLNVDGDWVYSENYITDELTSRAVNYLVRDHEKPFFLMLSHKAVHAPFVPAPRHANRYGDVTYTSRDDSRDRLDAKPAWGGRAADENVASEMRNYHRTVLGIDESVGTIRATLQEQGVLDDTLVVFTSDNGYLFGEHGGLMDKRAAYEPSIRIPLILRYPPQGGAGTICDGLALNIDLAPTLVELAGAPASPTIQGQSLIPLLRGEPGRDAFLYEYFHELGTVPTALAVRTREWKYVTYPDDPDLPSELYDLRADPGELRNLADQATLSEKQTELEERLAALLRATNFRMPGPPRRSLSQG